MALAKNKLSPNLSCVGVRSVMSDSCGPMGCTQPGSSVHEFSQ